MTPVNVEAMGIAVFEINETTLDLPPLRVAENDILGSESAGLTQLFDHIVSVEVVRSYIPSGAPYIYVAELLETIPDDLLMVACRDWDLAGARATGYQTAFVQRPAIAYANTCLAPDYSVADFAEPARR